MAIYSSTEKQREEIRAFHTMISSPLPRLKPSPAAVTAIMVTVSSTKNSGEELLNPTIQERKETKEKQTPRSITRLNDT